MFLSTPDLSSLYGNRKREGRWRSLVVDNRTLSGFERFDRSVDWGFGLVCRTEPSCILSLTRFSV